MKQKLTEERKAQLKAYKTKWEKENKAKQTDEKKAKRNAYLANWKKEKNLRLTEEEKNRRKEYYKKWKEANKQRLTEWYREYRKKNPEFSKTNSKKYRKNNPEKSKASTKKYKTNNADKVKAYRIKYKPRKNELQKTKKETDPLYALSTKIRQVILKAFQRNKLKKNSTTQIILGCTFEEFKNYIESKFEPWMTWTNRGLYNGQLNYGWDLDHIIPLSSAKNEEEIKKLNHFSNFQPLCSRVNRDIKRDNQQILKS